MMAVCGRDSHSLHPPKPWTDTYEDSRTRSRPSQLWESGNSVLCFFDSKSRKAKFLTSPTRTEPLEQIFADCDADLVVMEACGPSGWINDLAQKHDLKTRVCSTNEEAWRWANVKRKTDRDDALKLARLAAMGELKAVHTPTPEHREFQSLVKYRKTHASNASRPLPVLDREPLRSWWRVWMNRIALRMVLRYWPTSGSSLASISPARPTAK